MTEAARAQIEAAAPGVSTWLSANAGSGKTRVLTDRVARLLLDGVAPEHILCLTYTKAAAMEMQNRLFRRLGEWAMLDDLELRAALIQVGAGQAATEPGLLSRARTLFARAIEAPGGLKIQTIHSFCASVLRRFPLEAEVAPGFTEIDDRVQTRLITDLLDEMADDPARQAAVDGLVAHLSDEDGLLRLARMVAGNADAFARRWDRAAICDWVGIDPDLTEATLLDRLRIGDEARLCQRVVALLDPANRQQAKPHRVLSRLDWTALTLDDLAELEEVFLSGAKAKVPFAAKIGSFANATVRSALGDDLKELEALMARVEAARPLRLGLLTAARTDALHRFADDFLTAYGSAKQARGWLDFDDLIRRTRVLLTARDVAQWVLFRLDGGIDHILVDEAQDTSPEQWDIVRQLAEDFAAGEGARADVRRTIFVVGDKKQSIYSFQGADPAGFDRMRVHFSDRLAQVGAPFQDRELIHSFRSAPPILDLVDAVAAGAGAAGVGDVVRHSAFFEAKPGRVDLWPVVEPAAEKTDPPNWDDPQDLVSTDHHQNILARALADRIADMIEAGEPIEVEGKRRRVDAGDILILVQSRSPLFHKIIAALKEKGLPIAGVDRAQIAAPLAVKDLIALMRFLATPEDDLSLACVLRSPIAGWDEADLFELAHGREGYLWRALQARRAEWPCTVAMLEDLRNRADFLQPYDLLERVLIRHDARRRLVARLGAEAEDGVEAMLAQALSYERMEVPSLTGFVGWLESGEVTVKRDLAQAKGQIRVMTVHGAKGLEAPVVILPDCGPSRSRDRGATLVQPENGPMVWARPSDAPEPVREALDDKTRRAAEERNRLLYVAMTRAESWLIVAASGKVGDDPQKSWYRAVEGGLDCLDAKRLEVPELAGEGRRLQTGDWTLVPRTGASSVAKVGLPAWATAPAPRPPRDRVARAPSDLGGAKALQGEWDGSDEALALRRGRLVHLLLEHLPKVPEPSWPEAAPGIAALEAADVSGEELAPLLDEATSVLTAPHLSVLFGPDSLAEVELAADSATLGGPILGVIDRLIVTADQVLAVDFKTNRAVPSRPADVPEGLLRQMGAYAEMLRAIYPGHRVEVAILWSLTAELMRLPHDLVSAALRRARGA